MRLVCAGVREAFTSAAAARRLGIAVDAMKIADGYFSTDQSNVGFSYRDLLSEVDMLRPLAGEPALKPVSEYRLVGRGVPWRDLPGKLSGCGFVHDVELPGLWLGRVVRPPSIDAKLLSIDLEAMRKASPNVQVVVDGRFIGLMAERGGRCAGGGDRQYSDSVDCAGQFAAIRRLA